MKIPGYQDEELLFESEWSKIFRIQQVETGHFFILKTPGDELSFEKAKIIYQKEYDISQKLTSNRLIHYTEFNDLEGQPYLLSEDFAGTSLEKLIPERGFNMDAFFTNAIEIVNALAELHHKKIIHKDICPSNFAVNTKTGDLKLIDLGSASGFNKEIYDMHTMLSRATLAYISPEQTGRINRLVTYKTDFYSLGITFFQMLTGRLPFEGRDSSEQIYLQIAADTPHVKSINPAVPAQLNDIVIKLMSKNPDDRYNSALGLLSDLDKCKSYWTETKSIPAFKLAKNDVSEVFTIPDKIYGREEEIQQVKSYFKRAVSGNLTVSYITGRSGVGKSAVVTELYKDIVKEKGNFGIGKFDQFQRNLPYSALIQAFNQIIQKILTESTAEINKWKQIIHQNLGNNLGILMSVLPDLELITGKTETVEITNPALAKNRLVLAFKNLMKSFSQPKSPLVIFLDDLQWIDSATLLLFTDYFNSIDLNEKNFTLIIGAYRDNEVGPDHPLAMVLRDFQNRGFPNRTIKLAPLKEEVINEMCSEALDRKPEETEKLVSLIHTKTGGSPFFVIQFLEKLYDKGFIYLNRENGKWTWKLDQVEEAGFTENVVEFIREKIQKLGYREQEVLKIASCLGHYFETSDIVNIAQMDQELISNSLEIAMSEDIIYKRFSEYKGVFRFQHDRIQNAAYSLISKEELEQLDYKIGLYLIHQPDILENTNGKLFEGLDHINKVETLISDEKLRLKLAKFNLEAAKIARQSVAYDAALSFAEKGITFLPAQSWETHAELARDLHLAGTQSAYLIGEYDQMNRLKEQAMPKLTDPIDKANFHEIVTYAYASRMEWENTVKEALLGLETLGYKLPGDPKTGHVLKLLGRLFLILRRKKPENLINLPDLKDAKVEAALKLYISAMSAAYLTNQNMFAIFFIEMTRLSALHGNCRYSSFGYVGFGVFLGGALGFIEYGYKFGELGKMVFEKYRSDELQAKLYFTLYAFIQNWKIDVKELYPKLMEGFHVGSQVGENEYAAWCLSMKTGMSTLSGENLERLEDDLHAIYKYSENLKQIQVISAGFLEYTLWWLDKLPAEEDPLQEGFKDERGEMLIRDKFWTGLAEHDMVYESMYFYFFDYERAWFHASRGWEHHESLVGLFYYHQLAFYRAWTAIKLKQENPAFMSSKKLHKVIQDFKKWGVYSPPNHGHKLTMFEAELAVLNGDNMKAIDLFDRAIEQAEKTDHPNDQALFSEIAARHCEKWGKKAFAQIYIKQAYNAYSHWGAKRKLKYLETEYPELSLQKSNYKRSMESKRSVFTEDIVSTLDLESILKASQSISGEIQIDALLTNLLRILTETAGAQRVIILLNEGGKLSVEAIKEIGSDVAIQKIPLEKFDEIPTSLIHYIEKTKNIVLLDNASEKGNFVQDPYIKKAQEKSVLGIPIIKQNALQGIIYMNNNLASGVFTAERVEMIKTLSVQVAISLENASFIGKMQALNKSYNRFVPEEFLKMLARKSILEVMPGDQKISEMIIMFADIRNFTSLTESISAKEIFTVLNEYLTSVTAAIHQNGGTIDKFMGDGIMAIFPNNADKALNAVVQMQQQVKQFEKKQFSADRTGISIGIGLHIGTVILGTVGSDTRMSTTVIGDPVNLASRLESHTKINKTSILISGELAAKLKNPSNFHLRELGYLIAKGKTNKIRLIEEYSNTPTQILEKMKLHGELFKTAMEYFVINDTVNAGIHFSTYLKEVPEDQVAIYYYNQCRQVVVMN